MAVTQKGRATMYSNIAVGTAITARERTINGSLPPDFTAYGNGENIVVGTATGQPNMLVGTDEINEKIAI